MFARKRRKPGEDIDAAVSGDKRVAGAGQDSDGAGTGTPGAASAGTDEQAGSLTQLDDLGGFDDFARKATEPLTPAPDSVEARELGELLRKRRDAFDADGDTKRYARRDAQSSQPSGGDDDVTTVRQRRNDDETAAGKTAAEAAELAPTSGEKQRLRADDTIVEAIDMQRDHVTDPDSVADQRVALTPPTETLGHSETPQVMSISLLKDIPVDGGDADAPSADERAARSDAKRSATPAAPAAPEASLELAVPPPSPNPPRDPKARLTAGQVQRVAAPPPRSGKPAVVARLVKAKPADEEALDPNEARDLLESLLGKKVPAEGTSHKGVQAQGAQASRAEVGEPAQAVTAEDGATARVRAADKAMTKADTASGMPPVLDAPSSGSQPALSPGTTSAPDARVLATAETMQMPAADGDFARPTKKVEAPIDPGELSARLRGAGRLRPAHETVSAEMDRFLADIGDEPIDESKLPSPPVLHVPTELNLQIVRNADGKVVASERAPTPNDGMTGGAASASSTTTEAGPPPAPMPGAQPRRQRIPRRTESTHSGLAPAPIPTGARMVDVKVAAAGAPDPAAVAAPRVHDPATDVPPLPEPSATVATTMSRATADDAHPVSAAPIGSADVFDEQAPAIERPYRNAAKLETAVIPAMAPRAVVPGGDEPPESGRHVESEGHHYLIKEARDARTQVDTGELPAFEEASEEEDDAEPVAAGDQRTTTGVAGPSEGADGRGAVADASRPEGTIALSLAASSSAAGAASPATLPPLENDERLRLGELRLAEGIVTADDVSDAFGERADEAPIAALQQSGAVTREALLLALAGDGRDATLSLVDMHVDRAAVACVSAGVARWIPALPIALAGDILVAAFPASAGAVDVRALRRAAGMRVKVVRADEQEIRDALRVVYSPAKPGTDSPESAATAQSGGAGPTLDSAEPPAPDAVTTETPDAATTEAATTDTPDAATSGFKAPEAADDNASPTAGSLPADAAVDQSSTANRAEGGIEGDHAGSEVAAALPEGATEQAPGLTAPSDDVVADAPRGSDAE